MLATVRSLQYNYLLSSLSMADRALVEPCLQLVHWNFGDVLVVPNTFVDNIDFPVSGIASVISMVAGKAGFEVGMYGREGFGPAFAVLGHERTQNLHTVQVSGAAYRIGRSQLVDVMSRSHSLNGVIMRYLDYFSVQVGSTALSNASHATEERLARWLLMYQDRLDTPAMPLGLDTLATMLGISQRRVRAAVDRFAADDAVLMRSGTIKILNRDFLEQTAKGSYGRPEAEYRHLLGPSLSPRL